MAYTTIDKPSDYFNTKLYTGNGSTNAITGVGHQPDFTWIKRRDSTGDHGLYDAVRGVIKRLQSNENSGEATTADSLTAFGTDGFTMGSNASYNGNSQTYASWNWKAGTSFTNDASATGVGTIDSTGSVSTDAGFSIITYSATGSAATVAHGLGSAPTVMLIKKLAGGSNRNWGVYHQGLASKSTDAIYLDLSNVASTGGGGDWWNSTNPTSSVFSVGTRNEVNESGGTYIAYCFAEKQGYSKFGSYTGNGNADGNFIYTGFKPAFIILKGIANTENWSMYDNKRLGYNVDNNILYPNASDAEGTSDDIDLLSNGFKIRRQTGLLNDAQHYIYMTFAESPLVNSNGIPNNAR